MRRRTRVLLSRLCISHLLLAADLAGHAAVLEAVDDGGVEQRVGVVKACSLRNCTRLLLLVPWQARERLGAAAAQRATLDHGRRRSAPRAPNQLRRWLRIDLYVLQEREVLAQRRRRRDEVVQDAVEVFSGPVRSP